MEQARSLFRRILERQDRECSMNGEKRNRYVIGGKARGKETRRKSRT
jgi:hypothetical protein